MHFNRLFTTAPRGFLDLLPTYISYDSYFFRVVFRGCGTILRFPTPKKCFPLPKSLQDFHRFPSFQEFPIGCQIHHRPYRFPTCFPHRFPPQVPSQVPHRFPSGSPTGSPTGSLTGSPQVSPQVPPSYSPQVP